MKRTFLKIVRYAVLVAIIMLTGFTESSPGSDESSDVHKPYYYKQTRSCKSEIIEYDVAVYGGTPAAVMAAIQAAQMGNKAVLLSFNRHVGGMTSDGLTGAYFGKKESIGGFPISHYAKSGNPGSGLFPEKSSEPAGNKGEGDFKVLAYNFRHYLTNEKGRIPFPISIGFDHGRYLLLACFVKFDSRIHRVFSYTTKSISLSLSNQYVI